MRTKKDEPGITEFILLPLRGNYYFLRLSIEKPLLFFSN